MVSEHLHTRDPAIGTESLVKFQGSRTCLPLGESWRHPSSISRTKISKMFCFYFQCHYSFLYVYILKPCYYILVPLICSMFLCPYCLIFVVFQFKYHVKLLELFKIRCYIKYPLLLRWGPGQPSWLRTTAVYETFIKSVHFKSYKN